MRCLASSATAIFTPASAYFIVSVTRALCFVFREMRNTTKGRRVACGATETRFRRSWLKTPGNKGSAQPTPQRESGILLNGTRTPRGVAGFLVTKQVYQECSERAEDSLPAHDAGMKYGVRVGKEAFANLARLPGLRRNVERHVNHYRRADD